MKSKMVTVKPPESKSNENEAKMHFTFTSAVLAVLGTFKLHFNGLIIIICTSSSTHWQQVFS
jgi:hypothetical protein